MKIEPTLGNPAEDGIYAKRYGVRPVKTVWTYFAIGMLCAFFAMRDFDCRNFDRPTCRGFAVSEGMLVTLSWPFWLLAKVAGR